MNNVRLKPGRLYRRVRPDLPDSHPDAWVQPPRGFEGPEDAVYQGDAILTGEPCLLFVDHTGQRWAQPVRARGWDEPELGAPSNADPAGVDHSAWVKTNRPGGWG